MKIATPTTIAWSACAPRSAILVLIVFAMLGCGKSREERRAEHERELAQVDTEIAALAPRLLPLREKIAAIAAALTEHAGSELLGRPEPPLDLRLSGNTLIVAPEDLTGPPAWGGSTSSAFRWRLAGWHDAPLLGCFAALTAPRDSPDRPGDMRRLQELCGAADTTRYVAVVQPVAFRAPTVVSGTSFTAGNAMLEVLVFRFETTELLGSFQYQVLSNQEVSSRPGQALDERALLDDLDNEAKWALYRVLARSGATIPISNDGPTAERPIPDGWASVSEWPVSVAVPNGWRVFRGRSEFMLARWQAPESDERFPPTVYLERRQNDVGTFEQVSTRLADGYREAIGGEVRQRAIRDPAGTTWTELAFTQTLTGTDVRMSNLVRITLTRDSDGVLVVNCGVRATMGAEGDALCNAIAQTIVARE